MLGHFDFIQLHRRHGIAAIIGCIKRTGAMVAAAADPAKGRRTARSGQRRVPIDDSSAHAPIKFFILATLVA